MRKLILRLKAWLFFKRYHFRKSDLWDMVQCTKYLEKHPRSTFDLSKEIKLNYD